MLKAEQELILLKPRRTTGNGEMRGQFHGKQVNPADWAALRRLIELMRVCIISLLIHTLFYTVRT